MKDKIIEILREHQTLEMLVPDSKWVIMRDNYDIIADEILALVNKPLVVSYTHTNDPSVIAKNNPEDIDWKKEEE